MYNSKNYYMATKADFETCDEPEREPDYISYSGSAYWYSDDGVVRSSDHWGTGVASCDWTLDGRAESSFIDDGGRRSGFCPWASFEPTTEFTVTVYGVDESEATGHDGFGTPYAVVACTPENMACGRVETKWGDVRFDAFQFMAIFL